MSIYRCIFKLIDLLNKLFVCTDMIYKTSIIFIQFIINYFISKLELTFHLDSLFLYKQ